MMQKTFFLLLFIIMSLSADSVLASGSNPNNLLYIFDASGSMGKPMGARKKIEVAKEVLTAHLKEISPAINLGLIYFGNDIKGKKRITYAIEMGTGNRESIADEIKMLGAGGLTPLAATLKKALKISKKAPTTIVLITDGKEECGGDPVKVIKHFQKNGRQVELYIIGLGADKEAEKELAELSSITDGFFYNTRTAVQLNRMLKKISQLKFFEPIESKQYLEKISVMDKKDTEEDVYPVLLKDLINQEIYMKIVGQVMDNVRKELLVCEVLNLEDLQRYHKNPLKIQFQLSKKTESYLKRVAKDLGGHFIDDSSGFKLRFSGLNTVNNYFQELLLDTYYYYELVFKDSKGNIVMSDNKRSAPRFFKYDDLWNTLFVITAALELEYKIDISPELLARISYVEVNVFVDDKNGIFRP